MLGLYWDPDSMKKHTEARLEDAIIDHLLKHSGFVFVDYREGEAKGRYDKVRALDPALVLAFIKNNLGGCPRKIL